MVKRFASIKSGCLGSGGGGGVGFNDSFARLHKVEEG